MSVAENSKRLCVMRGRCERRDWSLTPPVRAVRVDGANSALPTLAAGPCSLVSGDPGQWVVTCFKRGASWTVRHAGQRNPHGSQGQPKHHWCGACTQCTGSPPAGDDPSRLLCEALMRAWWCA